jgi:SAM-dependent methyltransferase
MGASGAGPRADPLARLFPERRIVSFLHRQDRQLFFSMVSELVGPEHVVLDFGAGRNRLADFGPHLERLSNFKGRCAKVVGVDVDPVVLQNDTLDAAHVAAPGAPLPLPDESVDLIFSYAVFEHIEDPAAVVAELDRVLRPGGWICGWTPNRWGYVGLGARLVPNALHARLLAKAQPGGRAEKDVFPTRYRMNTRGTIARLFPKARYEDFTFAFNGQPSYNFGRAWIARLWLAYMALTPRALGQGLFVFVRKRATPV